MMMSQQRRKSLCVSVFIPLKSLRGVIMSVVCVSGGGPLAPHTQTLALAGTSAGKTTEGENLWHTGKANKGLGAEPEGSYRGHIFLYASSIGLVNLGSLFFNIHLLVWKDNSTRVSNGVTLSLFAHRLAGLLGVSTGRLSIAAAFVTEHVRRLFNIGFHVMQWQWLPGLLWGFSE